MNHGSAAVIWKQRPSRPNHPNGSCLVLHAWRKKARQSHSKIKTMLTVCFDWKGVVHHEYVPPSQTISKEYYLNVLHHLRDAKLPKWSVTSMDNWWLAASSRQCACSCIGSYAEFLAKHQIAQVTQPPHNPDLVPCDFWLFPKIKSPLKWKRFQSLNEIQENTMGQLVVIETKDFADIFNNGRDSGRTVWGPKVPNFEGDWSVIVLCTMFLVSCIFFNKCLYFSYYMDTFWAGLMIHIIFGQKLYSTETNNWGRNIYI